MKRSAVFSHTFFVCAVVTLPSNAIQLATELVASGFSNPVFLTSPPGDTSRMFIVEQHTGKIRIIKNGAVLPTPFLDVGMLLSPGGEQGLVGMTFHPRADLVVAIRWRDDYGVSGTDGGIGSAGGFEHSGYLVVWRRWEVWE